MSHLIGYARVSTVTQSLDQQRTQLSEQGCIRIFEEKISGARRDRPELARMLDHLNTYRTVSTGMLISAPAGTAP
ncbi:recombinase family protein [Pseudomonas viridiflava]|uniref:recombinase family protein n=1 Tax=Pseudomonas viridiflava TaxID=33069 RepID=UPI001C2D0093|nr:recombinase family protein [Pseudomonas viridiflava]